MEACSGLIKIVVRVGMFSRQSTMINSPQTIGISGVNLLMQCYWMLATVEPWASKADTGVDKITLLILEN